MNVINKFAHYEANSSFCSLITGKKIGLTKRFKAKIMKKLILATVLVSALPAMAIAEEKKMQNTNPSPTAAPEHVMQNTDPNPDQTRSMRNTDPYRSSLGDNASKASETKDKIKSE